MYGICIMKKSISIYEKIRTILADLQNEMNNSMISNCLVPKFNLRLSQKVIPNNTIQGDTLQQKSNVVSEINSRKEMIKKTLSKIKS